MQAVTETFWSDLNGRIACDKHIGHEASAKLQARPAIKTISTSLTKWFKMSEAEATEFADLIGANHTICETCKHN
jgi:hypothetical protein